MLRLHDGQATIWEALLPDVVPLLSVELLAADTLLDDPRFLEPFVRRFNCPIGRPTLPIDSYLRLMYLKHRHGLGYETLCKEVADSLTWRRFCRIHLDGAVPHPTTLLKLTRRFGEATIADLNQAALTRAVGEKLLRSRRIRVDTTVVAADVRYPTDSGLCAHAVSRLLAAGRRVHTAAMQAGVQLRARVRDRRRPAGRLVRQASQTLSRRLGGFSALHGVTRELRDLAVATVADAERVARKAAAALTVSPAASRRAVERLTTDIQRAKRVIEQTTQRLAGVKSIPDRLISLVDVDARPIRRGKPNQPNEFGFKVSVADTAEGFVVSHQVYVGNPLDASTLKVAVTAARASGMQVRAVVADRGYGNETADQTLDELGVRNRLIPRQGRAAPREQTPNWRRRYRWRAGAEGRISCLKRRYGLGRTRLKGHTGATIWVGFGVWAHNLDRMVALG